MDFSYKKLLYIAVAIAPITLYGYELHYNNFTDKTLIIASKKRAGIVEKYYQIVKPGNSVTQPWSDANCLESLQWAELNTKLPLKGGLDLIDPNQGNQIPSNKQKVFDETFFSKTTGKGSYLWNNLKIIMVPNEIYAETVKNATKLVQGFDKMLCQTTDILVLELKDKVFAMLRKGLASLEKELNSAIQKKVDAEKKNLSAADQELLNQSITDLKNKIASTNTEIEAYIKTKINTTISKQQCFFNLAQIAQAAGKIQGISICKNRQFLIFDTGQKDPLTGMPLYIAETGEGE
jgi:hypothetical protein